MILLSLMCVACKVLVVSQGCRARDVVLGGTYSSKASRPMRHLLLLKDALCVQDHADEESFSSECKEEVTRDQVRSNRDYRCPLYQCCTFAMCFGLVVALMTLDRE